jgi:thiamine pyrophosphate-dependent acetolactate synthase large subunit-like protein
LTNPPDFLALAQSFGCNAVEPGSLEDIVVAVETALNVERPTLIRVREDADYL